MNSDQTFVLLMTAVVCATVAFLGIVSAVAGRRDRKKARGSELPLDLSERLGRMEQGIDAIAIEVERVSEAQRFVTKILAERKAPAASIPERVITPHG